MNQPELPGARIEREVICDLCDCPTTEPERAEIKGSDYTLCPACVEDNIWQINDAKARDLAGCEESESDQEKK